MFSKHRDAYSAMEAGDTYPLRDVSYSSSVEDKAVRQGFIRKVFGAQ
jgi:hypothetical protein